MLDRAFAAGASGMRSATEPCRRSSRPSARRRGRTFVSPELGRSRGPRVPGQGPVFAGRLPDRRADRPRAAHPALIAEAKTSMRSPRRSASTTGPSKTTALPSARSLTPGSHALLKFAFDHKSEFSDPCSSTRFCPPWNSRCSLVFILDLACARLSSALPAAAKCFRRHKGEDNEKPGSNRFQHHRCKQRFLISPGFSSLDGPDPSGREPRRIRESFRYRQAQLAAGHELPGARERQGHRRSRARFDGRFSSIPPTPDNRQWARSFSTRCFSSRPEQASAIPNLWGCSSHRFRRGGPAARHRSIRTDHSSVGASGHGVRLDAAAFPRWPRATTIRASRRRSSI